MKKAPRLSLFFRAPTRRFRPFLVLAALGVLWLLTLAQQTPGAPPPTLSGLDSLRAQAARATNWTAYREHSIKLAERHFDRGDYGPTDSILHESLRFLAAHGQGDSLEAARIWAWLAFSFTQQERYADALDAYQQAIRRYESSGYQGVKLAYCYKNAAQIYIRWNSCNDANRYLEAALRSDTARGLHLSIHGQLANNCYWQKDFAAARRWYELGSRLPGDGGYAAASLQSIGGAVLLEAGELDSARQLTEQALAYYYTRPNEVANQLRCLIQLAKIAVAGPHRRPREAEIFLQKAQTLGKIAYPAKSRELANLYVETGLFYENNGQTDRALAFYQQALVQSFPHFNSLNLREHPALEEAGLETRAMDAAAAKARLLLQKKAPAAPERLEAAHCFELSFAVAARLRRVYGHDADKLAQAADQRALLVEAVKNLWALYRADGAATHLARLFALLERTRAGALADALQQQRALALAGVPDSLLAREEQLRLQAADAANELRKKELEQDSAALVRLQDRAFRQEKTYRAFLTDLQNRYPAFRQYTQADQPATLAEVQAALPDSAALLSWFDAGDRYLCLVVRRAELSALETPRDSLLDARLSGFLIRLADKSAQETAPDQYFTEAFALGERLLPPAVLASCRALVIVPDGQLSYLPFEALLTAAHGGGFGSAPYLLRSHTVRYAWSAALLATPPAHLAAAETGFLHIAPFAQTTRDGLAALPGSLRERPPHAEVRELIGPAATAGAVLEQARRCRLLHLATHAHAGGTTQAGIELYDRTLLLPEIYAQRLPTALVALSACETGAGEYAEGEGVLSLARAFAYAGAESLLASHWAVNERSTAQLFSHFYKKLESGTARAEALRQAKLDWLAGSEADARKAPWYWAAFTLSGADGPVDFSEKPGQARWWCGLAALAILAWTARRWSARRRAAQK